MAEDQLPRGELNLPRLSDIGPLVSHHNTPASECDKSVCFDGHTKEEVFRSIKRAFLSHRDNFKEELRDVGIPVKEIVVTGGVVRGNFGCRDIDRAKHELEQVVDLEWRKNPDISELAISVADDILIQDSVEDMWTMAENRLTGLTEEEILKEDVRIAICSDIDIFVIQEGRLVSKERWSSREAIVIRDKFTSRMFDDTVGEMVYLDNITGEKQGVTENTIISEEGFDEIIRRHYS